MSNLITKSLAALSISSLLCLPAAAQLQGGGQRGPGGTSKLGPTELQIALQARPHLILPSQDNPQRVVVMEQAEGDDLSCSPQGGSPDLSLRPVKILLPYEADSSTVRFEILHEELVPLGFFDVAPVGLGTATEPEGDPQSLFSAIPTGVQLDALGQNVQIYGGDEPWPQLAIGVQGDGRRRALRYMRVAFQPFSWNPATGELFKRENVVLKLQWERRRVPMIKRMMELGDPVPLGEMGLEQFVNGFDAEPWYGGYEKRSTVADFLIITTEEVIGGSSELGNFVSLKESQGHRVMVKSVESIDAMFGSLARSESIRRFVRQQHLSMGIRNLLLIGDPDPRNVEMGGGDAIGSVPMMMLWPGGAAGSSDWYKRSCATDAYYGELTRSNWDKDGDGRFGELVGDTDGRAVRPNNRQAAMS